MTDNALPLVDVGVLDALRESVGDDEEFVRDLVQTYVAEASDHLDALAEAVGRGDAAAMVRPAHTLKSSSASVGAMRLSDVCREIEAVSREGQMEGLGQAVADARSTWDATLEALRQEGLAA
ncbi:MAG TPA: Hpt domain-containing protein [Candidatus Limnocylindrales bacterium]|nr:Hpt domain-containing protein [Candidatus Limnocylindrales bacterium]